MLQLNETALPGVYALKLPRFTDQRGSFVKLVHEDMFKAAGLRVDFAEQFVTVSKSNVVRGMHFQLPPHDHVKLVSCVYGRILDVVLDLRRGLPSFGHCISLSLDADAGSAVYIPPGCAHGFLAQSPEAVTHYNVTSMHVPAYDAGVHWRSIGFEWPVDDPVISARDQALPAFASFNSPF
jgi:dTDP-4-dehydrorhamnose 3,5-epimerase